MRDTTNMNSWNFTASGTTDTDFDFQPSGEFWCLGMPERTFTQSLWKLLAINLFKPWKKCLDCMRSCRWNERGARGRKSKSSRENAFYLSASVEVPMSLTQTFKQSILGALRRASEKARKTLVHTVLIARLIYLVQRKTELTGSSKKFRGLFEVIVSL